MKLSVLVLECWDVGPSLVEFVSDVEQLFFVQIDAGTQPVVDGFHLLNLKDGLDMLEIQLEMDLFSIFIFHPFFQKKRLLKLFS